MSGCMAFDCAQESLPGHHYCAGHVPPSVVIDHLRAQLAEGAGDVVRATRDVAIVRAELVTKERNELRARVAELEAERDRWRESARDALRTCGACGWGWRAKGECGVSNCPNCEARRLEAERDRMRDELAALKKGAE